MERGRAVVAALLVLGVGGCTADDSSEPGSSEAPVVQLGAPGESNQTLSPEEASQPPAATFATEADIAFAQGMIPHHQQALEMAALVADRTASSELPMLVERMEVSQRDEITQIEAWLDANSAAGADGAQGDHGAPDDGHETMPGMLTDAEFAQLEAAEGRRFDRLFLQYMIRHHEGAISMVQQLLAAGGGQESGIFALSAHIESDQQVEIARMKQMLADL